jgi:hypothetical protein
VSFFAKGLDGRIDYPNAGWRGRGLWSTNGDRTPWLKEGGKGSKPRAVHIQVRPDPLAHRADAHTFAESDGNRPLIERTRCAGLVARPLAERC